MTLLDPLKLKILKSPLLTNTSQRKKRECEERMTGLH
jgi:hypothetical protein